jgi:hypothetical protein
MRARVEIVIEADLENRNRVTLKATPTKNELLAMYGSGQAGLEVRLGILALGAIAKAIKEDSRVEIQSPSGLVLPKTSG